MLYNLSRALSLWGISFNYQAHMFCINCCVCLLGLRTDWKPSFAILMLFILACSALIVQEADHFHLKVSLIVFHMCELLLHCCVWQKWPLNFFYKHDSGKLGNSLHVLVCFVTCGTWVWLASIRVYTITGSSCFFSAHLALLESSWSKPAFSSFSVTLISCTLTASAPVFPVRWYQPLTVLRESTQSLDSSHNLNLVLLQE